MADPVTSQPTGKEPPPGYGQPPAGYGPPPPGYGPPPPGYVQPGQPQQGYAMPPQAYGQPGQQGYSQPMYGAQQVQYAQGGAPMQGGMPAVPPGQMVWMTRPEPIAGCPPGLEYLTQIDQLLIQQQIEILEMVTGWESANKYRIANSVNQQVYFAAEESDVCMRQCCGPARGFVIHITDNMGQEVIRATREFKCCAGCCWCANTDHCGFEVTVEAPPGNVVGYVRQQQSGWTPYYSILDANHEAVLQIKGPCCVCQGICCTGDQEFVVFSKDFQEEVGKISKQWAGFVREAFTDAQNFSVTFPLDLDVKMKAVMMGAMFLIDFMFFEQKKNNN